MDDIFNILHSNLVKLESQEAFDEFLSVYKFRGGKYAIDRLFEIVNFYFVTEDGQPDKTRSLLGKLDGGYSCQVDKDEYQKLVDLKNIAVDKRLKEQ